jgi:DNA-binding GntR family transcriptional regulator
MVVTRPRLSHLNLGEQVYRAVREEILGRSFGPGTRIRVEHFTESLGVSRTPVLDALRRLEAEGLVSTVPRQGIYVVEFTRRRAEELYAVRGALEGLAGRLAAARVSAGSVEEDRRERLHSLLDEQTAAVRAQDFTRFSRPTSRSTTRSSRRPATRPSPGAWRRSTGRSSSCACAR